MPSLTQQFVCGITTALFGFGAAAGVQGEFAELLPSEGGSQDRFGVAVAHSGATAVVGAYLDDENGIDAGAAYVWDSDTGLQRFILRPVDGEASDLFGFAVASDGTGAVIGATGADSQAGAAYLYHTGIGVRQRTFFASDRAPGDFFGTSVGISGTTVIVGSLGDDDNGASSGSAYLFDTTTGLELFKLLPDDGAADDQFGTSVAISGAVAVIGARGDDVNGSFSGSAYLFDVTTGQQLFRLLPGDGAAGDQFGGSVAISGTTVIVGASGNDDNGTNSGAAYLFDAVTGQQITKLLPENGASNDRFGASVAIDGQSAIVGATGASDSGRVYVFQSATEVQITTLVPTDGVADDMFGASVAISDDTIVVGAPFSNDLGSNSGSAYLFDGPRVPFVVSEPLCIVIADLGSAPRQFSASYSGTPPLQFQWRFEGTPVSENSIYSGTTTDTLTIVPVLEAEGRYDLVVTNLVGESIGVQSVFGVRNTTPADINGDGIVDTADLGILIGNFGMMGP